MPGHEGTTRTNTDDYSIQGQVKRIHQVNCWQPKQWRVRLMFCAWTILQDNSFCSLSSVCGSHSLKQETFSPRRNLNGRKCGWSLCSLLPLRDLQHDSHLSRRSVSKSVHARVSVSKTKDSTSDFSSARHERQCCIIEVIKRSNLAKQVLLSLHGDLYIYCFNSFCITHKIRLSYISVDVIFENTQV